MKKIDRLELFNRKVFAKVKSGDNITQNKFYLRNRDYLISFLSKYNQDINLIEDAAGEALITFFKNIDSFQYNIKITSYLSTMALNRLKDEYRRENLEIYAEDIVKYDSGYIQFNDYSDSIKSIVYELNKINPLHKEIFEDFYFKELKINEISKKRNVQVNTIKTILKRVRDDLRLKFNYD